MKVSYWLVFKSEEIKIFDLDFEFETELPAVYSFEIRFDPKTDIETESIIRKKYAEYSGLHNKLFSVPELLKILLANGYSLKSKTNHSEWILTKEYFPVVYQAVRNSQIVTIGSYYYTSTSFIEDGLISFCDQLDQLIGVSGMIKILLLEGLSSGYSIVAIEPDANTLLAGMDSGGNILSNFESILNFLTK